MMVDGSRSTLILSSVQIVESFNYLFKLNKLLSIKSYQISLIHYTMSFRIPDASPTVISTTTICLLRQFTYDVLPTTLFRLLRRFA